MSSIAIHPSFPKSLASKIVAGRGNVCPLCLDDMLYCVDSRPAKGGWRTRRHACAGCGHRETTYEISEARLAELEQAEKRLMMIRAALTPED